MNSTGSEFNTSYHLEKTIPECVLDDQSNPSTPIPEPLSDNTLAASSEPGLDQETPDLALNDSVTAPDTPEQSIEGPLEPSLEMLTEPAPDTKNPLRTVKKKKSNSLKKDSNPMSPVVETVSPKVVPESKPSPISAVSETSTEKTVRRVLTIVPVKPVAPEPVPEPAEVKKKENIVMESVTEPAPKKRPKIQTEIVEKPADTTSPEPIAPVLSRMPKKKKFKQPEIKKLKKSSSNILKPLPEDSSTDQPAVDQPKTDAVDMITAEESKGSEDNETDSEESVEVEYTPLSYDEVFEYVSILDRFLTGVADTIAQLQNETNNSYEGCLKLLQEKSAKMNPELFSKFCLYAFTRTTPNYIQRVRLQIDFEVESQKEKWRELLSHLKNLLERTNSYYKTFKSFINWGELNRSSANPMQVQGSTESFVDVYNKLVMRLQENCSKALENEKHILDLIEKAEKLDEGRNLAPSVSPDVYLEQLLATIQELLFRAQPRSLDETMTKEKRSKIKKRMQRADPLYALAATTGVDPVQITRMTRSQQLNFVRAVQAKYPTPMELITAILESSTDLDFTALLNQQDSDPIADQLHFLEQVLYEKKRMIAVLEQKHDAFKSKNKEWKENFEWALSMDVDSDEEWIEYE